MRERRRVGQRGMQRERVEVKGWRVPKRAATLMAPERRASREDLTSSTLLLDT